MEKPRESGFGPYLWIASLSAAAFAQPLLDALARNPEFLVAHRAGPGAVAALAAGSVLLPAGGVAGAVGLARLAGPRAGTWALRGGLWLPASVLALLILKRLPFPPGPIILLAAAGAGAAFAGLVERRRGLREFLRWMSVTVLFYPSLFLFSSSIRPLWLRTAPAGAAAAPGNRPPIVFVVFDEFPLATLLRPDGTVDARRFPNFAALAADSIWFRNATTAADDTLEALPAVLTGRYPPRPPVLPTWIGHPQSLFTLLSGLYDFHAEETFTMLCPPSHCGAAARRPFAADLRDLGILYLHILLPDGMEGGLPSIRTAWRDFGRDAPTVTGLIDKTERSYRDRAGRFRRFVAGIGPTRRPTLHFIHTMLPHQPWNHLPSGRSYIVRGEGDAPGLSGKPLAWADDPFLAEQGRQRHSLQAGFTDRLLGELLDRLKKTGLYGNAVIVVTADHGIAFTPGLEARELRATNAREVLPVPLLLRVPGRAGRVTDRNVESIDILPTLAEAAGFEIPGPVDGVSALADEGPEKPFKTAFPRKRPPLRFPADLGGSPVWTVQGDPSRPAPYGALVGAPAPKNPPRAAGVDLRLDPSPPAALKERLSGAYLSGTVRLAPPRRVVHLAAAAGGRILAVGRTREARGGSSPFAIMLPEDAPFSREQGLRLFVVTGPPSAPLLSQAGAADREFSLTAPAGTLVLLDPAGKRVPEGKVNGKVERAFVKRDDLILAGWASGPDGSPAEAVLVFSGIKMIHSGPPELRGNSFRFRLPLAAFGDLASTPVRVFAVTREGRAAELAYWTDLR